MKITQVFRSQLKTLGKEPLRVLNAFGNCSSALYILEIEMTDDQDRKHKFKRIFDPMKQLELFEEMSLGRGVRSDAQLSSTDTQFQKCSQSGKNGSKHPLLLISMAFNVISCKKFERNTQKLKIADFTM